MSIEAACYVLLGICYLSFYSVNVLFAADMLFTRLFAAWNHIMYCFRSDSHTFIWCMYCFALGMLFQTFVLCMLCITFNTPLHIYLVYVMHSFGYASHTFVWRTLTSTAFLSFLSESQPKWKEDAQRILKRKPNHI